MLMNELLRHMTPSACSGWALHGAHQRVQPLLWCVLHVQIVFVHWFANQMPSYPKYKQYALTHRHTDTQTHRHTHTHTHTNTHTHKNTDMRAQSGCGIFKYSRQGFVVVQLICWLGAESIVSAINHLSGQWSSQSSCGPGCILYGVLAWRHYVLWSLFSTSSLNLRYCYVLRQCIYLF